MGYPTGSAESALKLVSESNIVQIKAPFGGGGSKPHELFIGNIFWCSPILLLVALHGMVSMKYADRLPLILCFPALEILLMQVCFGAIVAAASVVLNPKEPIHWGYILTAAVVMAAGAGWTVFVFATLWLHCSEDHPECSYTVLSGAAESQTSVVLAETSDCPPTISEPDSKATSLGASPTCIGTGSTGILCIASERSLFSEGSEGEGNRHNPNQLEAYQNRIQSPPNAYPIDPSEFTHASALEIKLAKTDAATEELLKLRNLFVDTVVLPEVDAVLPEVDVVLPEVDAETEQDVEPEPLKLDSDADMETGGQHGDSTGTRSRDLKDNTWAGCFQASGWGERGKWGSGVLQVEAEHSFDEMTVTRLNNMQHGEVAVMSL